VDTGFTVGKRVENAGSGSGSTGAERGGKFTHLFGDFIARQGRREAAFGTPADRKFCS
jgi:hypothetical protein